MSSVGHIQERSAVCSVLHHLSSFASAHFEPSPSRKLKMVSRQLKYPLAEKGYNYKGMAE